ncbi:50S ribosome-binding GTPase [Candidatus Woesearchaeota archaeon]|nr:50S ribosome-binding GTPase [Candidatus Woesearchaeota archaeon]
MSTFWKHVHNVLYKAELIIEVLDARAVEETRNREVEAKIRRSGKKLLYVINKCDLVDQKEVEKNAKNLQPSVFISSTEHLGTTILKKKILEISHGEKIVVGIVGYPNVGKSSLINALAGRGAAGTSPESGFTKGMQKIRVGTKIMLFDTPGVFPKKEKKDHFLHAKIGVVDYGKVKDPETAALGLIEENKEIINKHYQVNGDDAEEVLEQIALKKNFLLAGKKPNTHEAARLVLKEWQGRKIK